MIYKSDIRNFRVQYIRTIRQYREELGLIVHRDETYFHTISVQKHGLTMNRAVLKTYK